MQGTTARGTQAAGTALSMTIRRLCSNPWLGPPCRVLQSVGQQSANLPINPLPCFAPDSGQLPRGWTGDNDADDEDDDNDDSNDSRYTTFPSSPRTVTVTVIMGWLANCAGFVAPVFIILSPIISYGDQAMAMHRNKSSGGFSLDIPLIMLVASFFRCVVAACLRILVCRGIPKPSLPTSFLPMLTRIPLKDILLARREV